MRDIGNYIPPLLFSLCPLSSLLYPSFPPLSSSPIPHLCIIRLHESPYLLRQRGQPTMKQVEGWHKEQREPYKLVTEFKKLKRILPSFFFTVTVWLYLMSHHVPSRPILYTCNLMCLSIGWLDVLTASLLSKLWEHLMCWLDVLMGLNTNQMKLSSHFLISLVSHLCIACLSNWLSSRQLN